MVRTVDRNLTSSSDDLSTSRVRDLLEQSAAGDLSPVLRNVERRRRGAGDRRGRPVLAASPNIQGKAAIVDPAGPAAGSGAPSTRPTTTRPRPTGSGSRTARRPVAGSPSYVGSSLEAVHEATGALRRTLVIGGPLVLAGLGFLIWLVLGGALARLDRIRAEVDAIGHDQLDRRVADDGRRDEVGRLAATMNRMLGRVRPCGAAAAPLRGRRVPRPPGPARHPAGLDGARPAGARRGGRRGAAQRGAGRDGADGAAGRRPAGAGHGRRGSTGAGHGRRPRRRRPRGGDASTERDGQGRGHHTGVCRSGPRQRGGAAPDRAEPARQRLLDTRGPESS